MHNHTEYMREWKKINPIWAKWSNMKQRCCNKNSKSFKDYGERGISVCKRWMEYKNFEVDMFPSYKKGLTLDRIDVNGNYCKENCRWANKKQQANNRRFNTPMTHCGKTQNICQWADELKIKRSTLCMRIYKYKWSVDRALNV